MQAPRLTNWRFFSGPQFNPYFSSSSSGHAAKRRVQATPAAKEFQRVKGPRSANHAVVDRHKHIASAFLAQVADTGE